MKFLRYIFCLLLFTSCSSLIEKYYKQIDGKKETSGPNGAVGTMPTVSQSKKNFDNFALYRKYNQENSEEESILSTKNAKYNLPEVKRRYEREKRVKAIDLTDQSNPGSLWYDRGQDNFFFSQNDSKRVGDIVLVHVLKKLKDQIAQELSRIDHVREEVPTPLAPSLEEKNKEEENKEEENKNQEKIYDQISGVVIETINRDHLILRGVKEVLFHKKKHMIEIKALVKRIHVTDNDIIKSSDFLESSIKVLR